MRASTLILVAALGCQSDDRLTVHLQVQGATGIPDNTFRFAAEGRGTTAVGAYRFVDGVGTLEYEGTTLPAFVYESIPFKRNTARMHQGMAFASDDLVVFWLYCTDRDEAYLVYHETTSGNALVPEVASGPCQITEIEKPQQEITLPDLELDVGVEGGYTIDGPEVSIGNDGVGWLTLDDVGFDVYVFETVDCTLCGAGGFRELHSVLYEPETQRLILGIFYLRGEEPSRDSVVLAYGFAIPDLAYPYFYVPLDATWTIAR